MHHHYVHPNSKQQSLGFTLDSFLTLRTSFKEVSDSNPCHKHNEFESSLAPGKILFLMPCHSTPFFSHFHLANVDLRFLECPPRLTREDEATLDEADSFYRNPREKFEEILEEFSATRIVMFDSMTDELKDQLVSKRFELCQDFFHSHVSEGRVGSRVHVHCRAVDEREA